MCRLSLAYFALDILVSFRTLCEARDGTPAESAPQTGTNGARVESKCPDFTALASTEGALCRLSRESTRGADLRWCLGSWCPIIFFTYTSGERLTASEVVVWSFQRPHQDQEMSVVGWDVWHNVWVPCWDRQPKTKDKKPRRKACLCRTYRLTDSSDIY